MGEGIRDTQNSREENWEVQLVERTHSLANGVECFDPIREIESGLPIPENVAVNDNSPRRQTSSATTNNTPQKRTRGRPKRVAQSLPEPLFVPSTPSSSNIEALQTWNTAKLLGVQASKEETVISALRRSKRLLAMEDHNP